MITETSPDVVLLDIIMPKLDGLSVMERISEEKSLWKHGKMKDVIPLKDMWAKQKQIAMDSAKMERIYAIAYKGLYQNLVDLKDKIAKEKSR